jgi:hypothetical protein
MDPNQEYSMRNKELLDAFETDPNNPKVRVGCQGVQYYLVCISAYIIICGIPEKSTMRKWATITGQKALRPVGRPIERLLADKDIRDDMDTTEKSHALQWLIGWSELVADEDPTGSKYLKVIDLITYVEVWQEYCIHFETFQMSVLAKPVSKQTFGRVWDHWIKEYRVRIREKSKITTKCPGIKIFYFFERTESVLMSTSLFYAVCEELRDISTNRKATRAQLIEAKDKRARHRAFIRELRLRYHEDCQRALHDPRFQTITFDGADQAKTRVPQEWRKNVRGEYISDASLHQKLQTILIHGIGIWFFVSTPCIPKGMDLTVLSILQVLSELPDTVEEVRMQFDGGSENVNYAIQTLMGLLIYFGIFKHVYCNRLPVG